MLVKTTMSDISRSYRSGSLDEHVENIIAKSKMADQYRASSLEPFVDMLYDADQPKLRMSSVVCDPITPWSKTGQFYYPRYPESWRGTASSIPAYSRNFWYWSNPARYYRYKSYFPRYYYYPSRRYYPSSYLHR
eukprot:TRINITY_DN4351_c0_g1_i1.p1 TRINITY_DN4351_c0_g1~~TRINITY_DN4351_c0_g1_i1.p1  ORF type:complete len:152 (-),score=9.39 TRINITY_DN4351_c0_g1_i1:123-524(-)